MIEVYSHPFGFVLDGAFNRGIPNEERISIRSTAFSNTTNVGLMLGYKDEVGAVTPLPNLLFWFGSAVLQPSTTINIYTGGGRNSMYDPGNGNPVHNFFWGLEKTMLNHPAVVPVLFRIGEAVIDRTPPLPPYLQQVPQAGGATQATDILRRLGMDVENR